VQVKKNLIYLFDQATAATGAIEPIVISGFWRSGTTWLQQLVAEATNAKTIFEPLDRDSLIPFLRGKPDYYRGYVPATSAEFSACDWRALDRAFKGISPNRSNFSHIGRNGFLDVFRRRTVVKFVRAQMILGELVDRYQPLSTIHISRHPMPVTSSMMKADWNWTFDDINFSQFYKSDTCGFEQLAQSPLRKSHQKVAALWALTERAVQPLETVTHCRYETLVSDPSVEFPKLMAAIGLPTNVRLDFNKDSPVTDCAVPQRDRVYRSADGRDFVANY